MACVRRFLYSVMLAFALAATAFALVSYAHAQTTTTDGIQDLIQQIGLTGTDTGTTTQPTPPDDGGGGATDGAREPITTGLNNVTLGSLQDRAPGRYVQAGIAEHTGQLEIAGDADQFEEPSFIRQAGFDLLETILQSIQTGLAQILGTALGTAPIFGPGTIIVGDPLDNQTTTPTGDVVPLP
ncbi:MAG: hypothetical protein L6Q92_03840 [Phycisphaerae bacterium]|nr:hypothetical protein [Phycisphaerae bacterium]